MTMKVDGLSPIQSPGSSSTRPVPSRIDTGTQPQQPNKPAVLASLPGRSPAEGARPAVFRVSGSGAGAAGAPEAAQASRGSPQAQPASPRPYNVSVPADQHARGNMAGPGMAPPPGMAPVMQQMPPQMPPPPRSWMSRLMGRFGLGGGSLGGRPSLTGALTGMQQEMATPEGMVGIQATMMKMQGMQMLVGAVQTMMKSFMDGVSAAERVAETASSAVKDASRGG
jgi:hypothetical protein